MKAFTCRWGVIVAALVFAGCEGPPPLALEPMIFEDSPNFTAATASCYAVRGTINALSFPGGAVGTIQGDLQGTITTVLGPDPVGDTDQFITGKVFHLAGFQTVDVVGSSILELVGRTLVWTIETRAIHLPPIRRVSNKLTIVEGATGSLASHGILDLATLTSSFQYAGVICP